MKEGNCNAEWQVTPCWLNLTNLVETWPAQWIHIVSHGYFCVDGHNQITYKMLRSVWQCLVMAGGLIRLVDVQCLSPAQCKSWAHIEHQAQQPMHHPWEDLDIPMTLNRSHTITTWKRLQPRPVLKTNYWGNRAQTVRKSALALCCFILHSCLLVTSQKYMSGGRWWK